MRGLLEVLALHPSDARRAEEGGADRVVVLGSREDDGRSPEPALVEQMRAATSVQLRVLLRLREGFGTDGGEFTRLRGLAGAYAEAGADGLVLGFLNGHGEVDRQVIGALVEEGDWPWTFDAMDSVLDADRAWRMVADLPRLDQVLTAGSPRGVEQGLDDLLTRARTDPDAARLMLIGGGLLAEHVPWLARAGIRSFQVDEAVRPKRSHRAHVDPDLVHTWRSLIDSVVSRQEHR